MKPWQSVFEVIAIRSPTDRPNWVVRKIGETNPYYGKHRKYGYGCQRDAERAAAHHYKLIEKGKI